MWKAYVQLATPSLKDHLSSGRPARDVRFPVDWERDGHSRGGLRFGALGHDGTAMEFPSGHRHG